MATGDIFDIYARVKRLIPRYWFAWVAPIRDAVLLGLSGGAAQSYVLIKFIQAQIRLATAFGIYLDIISFDFTGRYLQRNGLPDDTFRALIKATILQERVTRAGMVNSITALVGSAPTIFEPWNTGDAGAYSNFSNNVKIGNFAYGIAGGWGNMNLTGQVFMTVRRSGPSGVPGAEGYGQGVGGYGVGSIEYIGPLVEQEGITDAVIYQTIQYTKPTGVICWTNIQ